MPKNRQLTEALIGYLLFLWAASAFAAGNALEDSLKGITVLVAQAVCAMSLGGGLAGTLSKIANADPPLKNVPLEMLKDLTGSIVLGWLVYFFSQGEFIPGWAQAGMIIAAGVGGSKALDKLIGENLGGALSSLMARLLGFFGKTPTKEEP